MQDLKPLKTVFLLISLIITANCGGSGSNSSGSTPPALSSLVGHPRIAIPPARLEILRQKAQQNDPVWVRLKNSCDDLVNNPSKDPGDIYALGLCYQVTSGFDLTQANRYATAGQKLLELLSDPSKNPSRDDGFDIRFYGVGMAVGYDWLYPSLSADFKVRIYQSMNRWIEALKNQEWNLHASPQGNYYAAYYAAKSLVALSTLGDNPQANDLWNDFYQEMHLKKVQPFYSTEMIGGGWPEGWNYGPLGTLNMTWPSIAAKSAAGIDLIKDPNKPFQYPLDQAKHLVYFSWPNLLSMDDRSSLYNKDNPAPTHPWLYSLLSSVLENEQDNFAPYFHSYTRAIHEANKTTPENWQSYQDFLFWNESSPEKEYKTLPKSYLAQGMNLATVRSTWEKDAIWATFTSGAYLNNLWAQGEYFDQGSLVIVRGGTPFLVNAAASLVRNTPGTNDGATLVSVDGRTLSLGDAVYDNNYGDPKKRSLYNIFYIGKSPSGQIPATPEEAKTHISRFEDAKDYVAMTGTQLEEMYSKDSNGEATINHWTREIVYLRPSLFVVFDRTQIANPALLSQWMNFYLGSDLANITTNGHHHYLVKNRLDKSFIGEVIPLLPDSHQENLSDVYGVGKVTQLQIKAMVPQANQVWLTVFDASDNVNNIVTAQKITPMNGSNISGVFLKNSGKEMGVIFSNDLSEQPLNSPLEFTVPTTNSFTLEVNDLSPNANYEVTRNGSNIKITPTSNNTNFKSSAAGVLFLTNL